MKTFAWAAIFFFVVVLMIADVTIRFRVNQGLPESEKISYFRRGTWRALEHYGHMYPDSELPFILKTSLAAIMILGTAIVLFGWIYR